MAFSKIAYNKNQLLDALEKSLGIVTSACKTCNLSRATFYDYLESDMEFKKKVQDIENISGDFVETQLMKNIKNGDTACIIFYAKTKLRNRGYVERQDINAVITTPVIQVETEEQKQIEEELNRLGK